MAIVPPNLFRSYLFGGRSWPQVRGGINVALIHKWIPNAHEFSLAKLASSRLNAKQIQESIHVMNADHKRGGVVLKTEISSLLIEKEWFSAKTAVILSFSKLFRQEIDISKEEEIIHYASQLSFSPDAWETVKKTAEIAYEKVFNEHKGLARLFSLALYQESQRLQFYLHHKEFYDSQARFYGLSSLETAPAELLQEECCQKIRTLLNQHLQENRLASDWITWGFNKKR